MLVTAAVGFFSLPMFLNYLGTEMYALWGYITTYTLMFGFADMGLGVVVGRYVGVALGKNDLAAVRGYWGTGNFGFPLSFISPNSARTKQPASPRPTTPCSSPP